MSRGGIVRDKLSSINLWVFSLVAINSILHFTTEITDKALHGPSGSITKSANSVPFYLEGEFLEHIDLCEVGITLLDSSEHVNHPASTFAAGRALTTTFMLIKLCKSEDSVYYISLIIHDNNGSSSETALDILQCIKVHQDVTANSLGNHGY